MAGAYYRLQVLAVATGSSAQRIEDAIDTLPYGTLVVQLRLPVAGPASDLYIQHAPVLQEAAFEDLGSSFALDTAGNTTIVYTNTHRFIRWRIVMPPGEVQFILDVTARDN